MIFVGCDPCQLIYVFFVLSMNQLRLLDLAVQFVRELIRGFFRKCYIVLIVSVIYTIVVTINQLRFDGHELEG